MLNLTLEMFDEIVKDLADEISQSLQYAYVQSCPRGLEHVQFATPGMKQGIISRISTAIKPFIIQN
jgi:hypothetical protein